MATSKNSSAQRSRLDRANIMELAGDLLDAEGLEALTLKGLAESAGVTQPALYRHIDSLDDVWRELGLIARIDLASAMAEASIGLSGADAVHAVAHAWRDYGRTHPGRYRSTERCPVSGDIELEAAVERVVDVLGLSLRHYELNDSDVAHGARLLRSALHGFVSFELGDGHPLTPPIDETFDRLVDLLCSGFATQAGQLS